MSPTHPETPLVWLGLAGFTVEQRAVIESAMVSWHAAGGLAWRLGAFLRADAWMIHGAKARLVSGQTLRVQPAAIHERVVQIDLGDSVRPMAFARPVSAAYREHPLTFELAEPGQILTALAGLEAALVDVRTNFALGGALGAVAVLLKTEFLLAFVGAGCYAPARARLTAAARQATPCFNAAMRSWIGGCDMKRRFRPLPTPPAIPNAAI